MSKECPCCGYTKENYTAFDQSKIYSKAERDAAIEAACKDKDQIIDWLLSRVGVDLDGVYLPCGNTKVSDRQKRAAIRIILNAPKEQAK